MPGPFYFAWTTSSDSTFSESDHVVEDEDVFAFELEHIEGEFPVLHVEVRNPRIGLLNAGRNQWAWFSWDSNGSDGIVPLFFGRLIGIPEDVHAEEVRLSFMARPTDWDAQREALAATMKVTPYWDHVWVAEERRADPDAVLDARSALWHIDRVTHDVTASDITAGEDGTVDLAGDIFYDSLAITYNAPPASSVEVEADVYWTQAAAGTVDLTNTLIAAFKEAGTTDNLKISSYTGEGLQRDWPEKGLSIGAGWTVGESSITRADGVGLSELLYSIILKAPNLIAQSATVVSYVYNHPSLNFPLWRFWPVFKVDYAIERSFAEKITFTLNADVQALVADPGDDEVIRLQLSSREVGEPIDPATTDDPDGVVPIGDVRRRSYFNTDRGKTSLEWLIARARAELMQRARAVDVAFETRWENGIALSCRKSVRIADSRLPGGEATGKVVSYTLFCNGDTGELGCGVVIGCTIGNGGSVSTVAGTPDYVEAGYVETGYQTYTGTTISPITGEVTYTDFHIEPNDDGVDFHNMRPGNVLIEDSEGNLITVNGGQSAQEALFEIQTYTSRAEAEEALKLLYTEWCINLVPLNTGPFDDNEHALTVSNLMIPKTLDLEAESSA